MAESNPAKQKPGPAGRPASDSAGKPAGKPTGKPGEGAAASRPPRPGSPARPTGPGQRPRPPPGQNIDELKGKVSDLSKAVEEERAQRRSVDEKVASVEDRLKSLMKLSELLSVRYNPFLEESEGALFDERYSPDDLVAKLAGGDARLGHADAGAQVAQVPEPREPAPAPAAPEPDKFEASPLREVVNPEALGEEVEPARPPPPAAAPTAPDAPAAPVATEQAPGEQAEGASTDEPQPRPPRPKRTRPDTIPDDLEARVDDILSGRRRAAVEAPREPPGSTAEPEPMAEARPAQAKEAPQRPVTAATVQQTQPVPAAPGPAPRGVRQSYLAIAWLDHLGRAGKPEALPRLLDYYHRVGWTDDDTHAWLRDLAAGLADPPEPPADTAAARPPTWDDVGLKAPDLAKLHRKSLRFLELLRQGFVDEDFDRVEAAATALLEER